MSTRPFPGRAVKAGEKNATLVREIQRRLNDVGCGPIPASGFFDTPTTAAVKLFQALFPDALPAPAAPVPPLLQATLDAAADEIGVLEVPPGSNRGPSVDEYLRTVGLDPAAGSYAWCAAFICWCFGKGAASVGTPNPLPRTAGALSLWRLAGAAGVLTTIEGNTNDGGSREGIGVFRRTGPNGRKIASINKGFLDVAA